MMKQRKWILSHSRIELKSTPLLGHGGANHRQTPGADQLMKVLGQDVA